MALSPKRQESIQDSAIQAIRDLSRHTPALEGLTHTLYAKSKHGHIVEKLLSSQVEHGTIFTRRGALKRLMPTATK